MKGSVDNQPRRIESPLANYSELVLLAVKLAVVSFFLFITYPIFDYEWNNDTYAIIWHIT